MSYPQQKLPRRPSRLQIFMRLRHVFQIVYFVDPNFQIARLHGLEQIASIVLELLSRDNVVH